MTTLVVIHLDIFANGMSGFTDITILCEIGLFILKGAKPTFNHDIIGPAAFAIHALADMFFAEE